MSKSRCTTFTMLRFDGKYPTSYLLAIVMFAQSLTIYELFANIMKCQRLDLTNEIQGHKGEKRNSRQSTGNARFNASDVLRIVAIWDHTFT